MIECLKNAHSRERKGDHSSDRIYHVNSGNNASRLLNVWYNVVDSPFSMIQPKAPRTYYGSHHDDSKSRSTQKLRDTSPYKDKLWYTVGIRYNRQARSCPATCRFKDRMGKIESTAEDVRKRRNEYAYRPGEQNNHCAFSYANNFL